MWQETLLNCFLKESIFTPLHKTTAVSPCPKVSTVPVPCYLSCDWGIRRQREKTWTADICLSAWVHHFLSSSSSHFTSSPLFLHQTQEQTHLLYHDASLPLSALSLCWNWQEINPALICNPSHSHPHSLLPLLLLLPLLFPPFMSDSPSRL